MKYMLIHCVDDSAEFGPEDDCQTPGTRAARALETWLSELTARGVLGGGIGLATGLVVVLFPFAAIGGGLLLATTAGGAVLGAVAGHAAAGMSRSDLKELGEHLDAGQAGLVVVGVSDMGAKIERAMKKAEKVEAKELKADTAEIEADAKSSAEAESAAEAKTAQE